MYFHVIDANPASRKGFSKLTAVAWVLHHYSVLRKLRKDNPSLIVMVNSLAHRQIAMGMIAKSLHLPLFVRLRGGMWREFSDKWHFKPFPIKQFFSGYLSLCHRLMLSLADGIIPVSYFLKNQIICKTDIDLGEIIPVYNPINSTAFDETQEGNFRNNLKIPEHAKIMLTVTNFNYYKKYMGITYYLPAILQVLRENQNWYFIIVGAGYSFERARKSILEMVTEDMKDRIIFTGYYKPIEEAFTDADIVVNLAFRETLGMVILEAQAAGKPVVVNDFGGMPELLQNRYDKPSCVIKEISELYQSLTTLVNSEELREFIGRKNRQAVAKKFTNESIGHEFYRCINSLIGKQQKCRSSQIAEKLS